MSQKSNLNKLSSSSKKKHNSDENSNQIVPNKKEDDIQHISRKNNNLILTKDNIWNKYSKFLPWIIILIVVLVYSNSINNDFLNWDDDRYVTGNPYLVFSWENIKYFFNNFYFVMYIPVTMISYMIDYYFVGISHPWFYHLHNLLLHLINTYLVFVFIKRLLSKHEESGNIYAFFVAILFGIHPLHVESVSWIAERKDVLYTFYFLLSLLSYLKYIISRKKLFFIGAFLFFVLSLLSKTQAVVLPLVYILIDYLILGFTADKQKLKDFLSLKDKIQWKIFLEKIPFLILSAIFGYIAIKASGSNEPFLESAKAHRLAVETGYGFVESVMLVSYSLFLYFVELFVPFKQSAIHPYPFDAGNMPQYFYLYLLFSLLYIGSMIWAWYKKKKLIFISLAFFFFNIFIVLRIKNFVISEHYEYIPAIGIFILFVKVTRDLLLKYNALKQVILFFTLFYILFLAYTTFERNKVFKDSITFWNDVSDKYPNVIVSYYNRANYLQKIGDEIILENNIQGTEYYQKAIIDYQKTIEINKSNIGAYSNLGIIYAKLGEYQSAIDNFNHVVKIDSTYGNVYSNRGNAFALLGKWNQALSDYNKSLALNPDFSDALFNRGIAHTNTGKYKDAITDFNRVLILDSNKKEAYMQRGFSYFFSKEYTNAINDFNIYLKLYPDAYNILYYRTLSYQKKGNLEEEEKGFRVLRQKYPQVIKYILQTASKYENIADNTNDNSFYNLALNSLKNILKIESDNSDAYTRIGVIFAKQGNLNKAFDYFNKSILFDSTNADAFSNRGYAYFLTGKISKSLKDYNNAIRFNPSDIVTYYNRGLLYEKINNLNNALDDYTKVIELKKDYGLAYLRRALILYKKGNAKNACDDLKNAQIYGVKDATYYLQKYCN